MGNNDLFSMDIQRPGSRPDLAFHAHFPGCRLLHFSFFIDWGQPHFLVLIGYALSFALINAVLEELLWRGDTYLVIL